MTLRAQASAFIELLLESRVLLIGDFVTKAGLHTPYFLNFGNLATGKALAELGKAYAARIQDWGIEFDMLFGAAYKGIPIATATAFALAEMSDTPVKVGFNRKETKDHGEGGDGLGAPMAGRVLLLDDVTSAGTTAREMQARVQGSNAEFVGMLVGVDRQDPSEIAGQTFLEAVSEEIGVPIKSIVTKADIQTFVSGDPKWAEFADVLRGN
ncbi:MAG: orotate phosphoribosyltransferase [Gammaproteobacteria bacterium]|nr:orotate phosphoribosyltransferase [Gammaproteobacteria bacterium]